MVLLARRFVRRVHMVPFNALRLWLSVLLWFAVQRTLPTSTDMPPGLLWSGSLAGFFGPFLSRIGALQSGRYIPAQLTALAALATPVLALLFAFVVLGDLPSPQELVSGAMMLVGVAIPLAYRVWTSRSLRPGS